VSSQHLSSEQVSAWIAGDRPEQFAAHLQDCAECRAEISAFESVTGALRSQLQQAASSTRIPAFQPKGESFWGGRLSGSRWALACALTAALIAIPIYQQQHKTLQQKNIPPAPVLSSEISDAALLQQVDAQLSRGVPGSMEPLTALVWSPQELQSAASAPTHARENR